MLPLLTLAGDGKLHSMAEAREKLGKHFQLTPDERAELLPSGRQATFDNRVAWAKGYLLQAGLVESPKRGVFQITQRGREVLDEGPTQVNIRYLEQFPEFVAFRSAAVKKAAKTRKGTENGEPETPEEALEEAYQAIRDELTANLLKKVKEGSPEAFERLVVELLLRMGYGGSRKEAGEAIGRGGDEGLDGIIREDRLGLDVIYLQAKRWEGTVGRPEVQKFVGALHGKQAKKGVFITTGTFSAEARDYVAHIDPKVVLIDGERLTDLMVDHSLGVTTVAAYELKRIDSDYFDEE
jgi:restriction system protein